jgi:hypothetical protein
MSRSTSERVCTALAEFLVLVLTLRVILDRLFIDLRLQGTKGARMVVRADLDSRDSLEAPMNNSGGYTGSTGAGEWGIPAGLWTGSVGGGGPINELRLLVSRF